MECTNQIHQKNNIPRRIEGQEHKGRNKKSSTELDGSTEIRKARGGETPGRVFLPDAGPCAPGPALAVVHFALACSASSRPPVGTYEKVGAEDETWRSPFVGFLYHAFGWTAFFSWSCSFYPQIWENYRTWSVEGISFDFVSFNFIKHSSYGAYNVVLYFARQSSRSMRSTARRNDTGRAERRGVLHPRRADGDGPDLPAVHAAGQQRITFTATMILAVAVLFILINLCIALSGKRIFGLTSWLGSSPP